MRAILSLILAALASSTPAHAATLTASGVADVVWFGFGDDPPIAGVASFAISDSFFRAFEFTMLGLTWTLADVDHTFCENCIPQGTDDLNMITINFADEQGVGLLIWDFIHSDFGFFINTPGFGIGGTSDFGTASGVFRFFDHRVNLPEPGSLALLALGLLAFGAIGSRRW